MSAETVVVGQVARDLVLRVDTAPRAGDAAPVRWRREMLGGKGANQAVGLRQLGSTVAVLGAVGDDHTSDQLLRHMAADGLDESPVARRRDTETALIVDVVDDYGQWRYFEHIPAETLASTTDVFAASRSIEGARSVIVQLQQPASAALAAAKMARASGARVVLDGAPAHDQRAELLACADVLRADGREAGYLVGAPVHAVPDGVRAGTDLLDLGPSVVVLEIPGKGNVFVEHGGYEFLPLLDTDTVDTTGSGDALVAGLTHALDRGEHLRYAARCAVGAAAATVRHAGGRPNLSWGEVTRLADELR